MVSRTVTGESHAAGGFTLIELLVALAIIGTLLSIVVPRYFGSIEKAEETALKKNLSLMREAIDRHYGDTGSYPKSLDELVDKKYLRHVPVDPMTGSAATWIALAPKDKSSAGVFDVKSGADGKSRDGTPYREW